MRAPSTKTDPDLKPVQIIFQHCIRAKGSGRKPRGQVFGGPIQYPIAKAVGYLHCYKSETWFPGIWAFSYPRRDWVWGPTAFEFVVREMRNNIFFMSLSHHGPAIQFLLLFLGGIYRRQSKR
ncbi:hypothetical protein MAP00_002671 [Monascus purpureus]|nr:hypothetical protein MAP00_002671 [Monascus purpureus]